MKNKTHCKSQVEFLLTLSCFNLDKFEKAKGAESKNLFTRRYKMCQEYGFLLISGHQVLDNIINAQWTAVSIFCFTSRRKTKPAAPYPGYPLSWIGPNREALSASKSKKLLQTLKRVSTAIPAINHKEYLIKKLMNFAISLLYGLKCAALKQHGKLFMRKWSGWQPR